MDIARAVVTVGVSADDCLMLCEMFAAKLLAESLGSVNRQAVLNSIARIKADYVMVAFNVAPTAIFSISEIGFHTGDCEIIIAAI